MSHPFSIFLLSLSFSLVCLVCFACISEHVRFRDFNWPEGIPPCGLTLRENFRDILSRAWAEGDTLHTLFFRLHGKSPRLSQHRAAARFWKIWLLSRGYIYGTLHFIKVLVTTYTLHIFHIFLFSFYFLTYFDTLHGELINILILLRST